MNALVAFLRDVARSANQPCREHAKRIDRALDARLTPGEAFGLRLHLLYCRGCRRFRQQVAAIRALASREGESIRTGDPMPADVRGRLDAALRHAAHRGVGRTAPADGGPGRDEQDSKSP